MPIKKNNEAVMDALFSDQSSFDTESFFIQKGLIKQKKVSFLDYFVKFISRK